MRAIALLITVVSILAAVAAWRASVVSGNAGGPDQQGDAQEELALARTIYQAFSVKPRFGQTEYDEEWSRGFLRSFNLELITLDPETADLAEDERSRGVSLVGITSLFGLHPADRNG